MSGILGANALGTTLRAPASVVGVAWMGTLLASRFLVMALGQSLAMPTAAINVWWAAIGGALAVAGAWCGPLRPLQRYFVMVLAVILVTAIADVPLRAGLARPLSLTGVPDVDGLVAERLPLIPGAILIAALAILLTRPGGTSYMAVGSFSAPVGRLFGWKARWSVVAPLAAAGLVLFTAAFSSQLAPVTAEMLGSLPPLLAAVLVAAALNALAEEVLYRASFLGPLVPVVGARQAVWMTAVWFGLGHVYGGIPSGVAGLVYAGAVGLLFGAAMVQTRGLAWPWFMHFAVDATIYTFLALRAAVES
jgi:membrane protease YdiL (CAAX protease family)